MHDIKDIRDNAGAYDKNWARRGLEPQTPQILAADEKLRGVTTQLQAMQTERNALSQQIGAIKQSGGNADELMAQVNVIKEEMHDLEVQEDTRKAALEVRLLSIPNLLLDDVPHGTSEADNKEITKWGSVTIAKGDDHVTIGEKLGLIDFEAATKMSGARFVVLKGAIARLERALAQFMLDVHTSEHGLTEISPPLLVNADALVGTNQLPKFEEDMFKANTGHYMISTAEISLTNLVRDAITDEKDLPLRYTAYTPCFRSEAGSAGRDTRGMLRQHQFYKVEMVSIVKAEEGLDEHKRMLCCAETILQKLEIPYRVVDLCAGDVGFGARKTYDIEAWLPGQETYREISSVSYCGDFQARRMNARYKTKDGKNEFLHTLNGSGVAVGRCLIAVLENNWDGTKVTIPEVLHPYMNGLTEIS